MKFAVLLAVAAVLLVLMSKRPVPGALDKRFYYTSSEAAAYLEALTPEQKADYRYAEKLDLLFIADYSLLLFAILTTTVPRPFAWLSFLPGVFDIYETGGILFALGEGPTPPALGWATAAKWTATAVVLAAWLIARGRVELASRRRR